MPSFFENIENASLWIRLLVALVAFAALVMCAAGGAVSALMFVAFSADSLSASEVDNQTFDRVMYIVLACFGIAVFVPPLMLLCKAPVAQAFIPAAAGFVCAGIATMWYIMSNVGSN